MEIHNRIADITKLRSNILQDFLKLIIVPDWKTQLPDILYYEIEVTKKHADKYREAYDKIRRVGVENYSIDDMDVTLICQIVNYQKSLVPEISEETKSALNRLQVKRNISSHSSDNETKEELFLRSIISLDDMRNFLRTVDRKELEIDNEQRLDYRRGYEPRIDELNQLIIEEWFHYYQEKNKYVEDFKAILEDENPEARWNKICSRYLSMYKVKEYAEFVIKASDYGIKYAHIEAATALVLVNKEYIEALNKLLLATLQIEDLSAHETVEILKNLNQCIQKDKNLNDQAGKIIEQLREKGKTIFQDADGYYYIKNSKGESVGKREYYVID